MRGIAGKRLRKAAREAAWIVGTEKDPVVPVHARSGALVWPEGSFRSLYQGAKVVRKKMMRGEREAMIG